MKNKRKLLPGYTLLELLIVMGIFIILGALGVGGYIGTRETLVARENVELIKQDLRSARSKAMLLEKGSDDNWLYGIGIDFSTMGSSGGYRVFKWCSQFEDFGDPLTKSLVLGWDPTKVIKGSTQTSDQIKCEKNTCYLICGGNPGCLSACSKVNCTVKNCVAFYCKKTIISGQLVPSNGYLTTSVTNSCQNGLSSQVNISFGDASQLIKNAKGISIGGNASNIVFEALTGRAFLYNADGEPSNYSGMGIYDGSEILDVVITRKSGSKFDVISVYPESGTVIHHVYSSVDENSGCSDNCLEVNGKTYDRYGISDEINSYRD